MYIDYSLLAINFSCWFLSNLQAVTVEWAEMVLLFCVEQQQQQQQKNFTAPQHHSDVRNFGDVEAYQGYRCHHSQIPQSLPVLPGEKVVQFENDDIYDKKNAAFLYVMPACRFQMKQCR